VCGIVRFANVLFCALAVHFKVFIFSSLYCKLYTVLSFTLGGNVGGMKSCRLRAISYPVTQKLKRATTLE